MSQEEIKQFSNLLSELNAHLVKVNNIVFEMNNIMNKLNNNKLNSMENDFMEQMNDLLKRINGMNYNAKLKASFDDIHKLNEDQTNSDSLKNIIFKTTLGSKTTLEVNNVNTIDELLKQYLCQINRMQLEDDFQERRPDWCPLKPLPNRKEDLHYPCNEYLQAVNEGWNNCLDEITDHIGESIEKVCNDDLYESWMFFDEGETE